MHSRTRTLLAKTWPSSAEWVTVRVRFERCRTWRVFTALRALPSSWRPASQALSISVDGSSALRRRRSFWFAQTTPCILWPLCQPGQRQRANDASARQRAERRDSRDGRVCARPRHRLGLGFLRLQSDTSGLYLSFSALLRRSSKASSFAPPSLPRADDYFESEASQRSVQCARLRRVRELFERRQVAHWPARVHNL